MLVLFFSLVQALRHTLLLAALPLVASGPAAAQDTAKVVPHLRQWGFVESVAFSPDGRSVLSGRRDQIFQLWDAATGRLVRTFEGHLAAVIAVAFLPDGRSVLSGSSDKTLKHWDVATGRVVRTFEGHSEAVTAVALAPNGRSVLSGSADKTLKLWDVALAASCARSGSIQLQRSPAASR